MLKRALWTDVNRLTDMGLTNINEARITSTKFYDPTLQGGKVATYSGPRALAVVISAWFS